MITPEDAISRATERGFCKLYTGAWLFTREQFYPNGVLNPSSSGYVLFTEHDEKAIPIRNCDDPKLLKFLNGGRPCPNTF